MNKLLDYKEYEVITGKLIGGLTPWLAKRIFVDNDLYTDAINAVMMADWQFNGKGTLYGYRKYRFNCFIKSLITDYKNKKVVERFDTFDDYPIPAKNLLLDIKHEVKEILERVSPKDRALLEKRFMHQMTLEEIAKENGCSKEAVRQQLITILANIRKRYEQH